MQQPTALAALARAKTRAVSARPVAAIRQHGARSTQVVAFFGQTQGESAYNLAGAAATGSRVAAPAGAQPSGEQNNGIARE
jgi:hypothetical protein